MPDYQLGKIYKIVDNTNGNIYVGSTTRPTLAMRLAKHVSSCKSWKEKKTNYTSSFKIIENQNYDIVLLENYSCNSKDELIARERYYIENSKCINIRVEGRTKQESLKHYQESNREKLNEKSKNYYKESKDKIKKYQKENKEKIRQNAKTVCDCICGKMYTYSHKSQHIKSQFHQNFINSQEQKLK